MRTFYGRHPAGGALRPLARPRRCGIAAEFWASAAAVFRQEQHELPNALSLDGVEDTTLLPPRPQESCPLELRQVRRHSRGGDPYLRGNLPGRQPVRSVAYQEPQDSQTVFLGQSGQGLDGSFFFHISIIWKITKYCKRSAHLGASALWRSVGGWIEAIGLVSVGALSSQGPQRCRARGRRLHGSDGGRMGRRPGGPAASILKHGSHSRPGRRHAPGHPTRSRPPCQRAQDHHSNC